MRQVLLLHVIPGREPLGAQVDSLHILCVSLRCRSARVQFPGNQWRAVSTGLLLPSFHCGEVVRLQGLELFPLRALSLAHLLFALPLLLHLFTMNQLGRAVFVLFGRQVDHDKTLLGPGGSVGSALAVVHSLQVVQSLHSLRPH